MTDLFTTALGFTLKWEGKVFTHDPDDRGGATYRGVTQRVYDAFRRGLWRATRSVKYLTDDELQTIYRRDYWLAAGCDQIADRRLAVAHFDFAVNSGVNRAIRLLQKLSGTLVDGKFGPKTKARVNHAAETLPTIASYYIDARENFLRDIVKNNPRQGKYIKGWLNRTRSLRAFIAGMDRA